MYDKHYYIAMYIHIGNFNLSVLLKRESVKRERPISLYGVTEKYASM